MYDCRVLPKPTDKASTGRILYLTYKDYADQWDEIAGIFSREEVLTNFTIQNVKSAFKR